MKVGAVITPYSRWVGIKDTESLRSLPMVMVPMVMVPVVMLMQLVCEYPLWLRLHHLRGLRCGFRTALSTSSVLTLVLCPPAAERLS